MNKAIMFVLMSIFLTGMVSASPVLVNGNPTCAQLGYENSIKIDSPVSGTYDGITFTLNADKKHFDWSSTSGVDAVIAKGGNRANVYYYDPVSTGDNGMVAPLNNGGQVPTLSHAVFCYDEFDQVPEFSVVAASVALLGAFGIFLYQRKN